MDVTARQHTGLTTESLPVTKETNWGFENSKADLALKKSFGFTILGLLVLIALFSEYLFFRYLQGNQWKVGASVIDVWLSATVVEIFSAVAIVLYYLFDRKH